MNTQTDPVSTILSSRKYRGLVIPPETARDIYDSALRDGQSPREAEGTLRHKLHNIVAPYLGDPDFPQAISDLTAAFETRNATTIDGFCQKMLESHASTRERLVIRDEFYMRIFEVTGSPGSILDLACGMNPFFLPWMHLQPGARYLAYDLNAPRVDLIRQFLSLSGMEPLAFHQDILLQPPAASAEVAFLFKEAHRMEQRQRGSTRHLIQSVKASWFLLSLPPASLHGKHNLASRQRRLVDSICAGSGWSIEEIDFRNEIVFCIRKEAP